VNREGSEQRLYQSSAAAKELGLHKTTLNKLALAYEQVHGELPRGQRHARLWTLESIERIRSARLAVKERRAVNIETALRDFENCTTLEHQSFAAPSSQTPGRSSEGTPEADYPSRLFEVLVGELHALREAVEDQNKLLRDQTNRLQRLETAAPFPEITSADTSIKEASLEMPHSPESSAGDQEEGEKAQRAGIDPRVSGMILPIVLVTVSVAVTVISTLYNNVLLLTASLAVVAISFLFGLYYYTKG
jgi:hypothetical protein